MFKDCGIGRFDALASNIESAKFLSGDAVKPVMLVLVVMRNRFQVEEILTFLSEAWRLGGGKCHGVYLSKDRIYGKSFQYCSRSIEREQYKKAVEEIQLETIYKA